jgi:hypothetical protein
MSRYIYPILALGIAGIGAWRSISDRMRSSRRTDIKGIFDRGSLRRSDLVPLSFEVWKTEMRFHHGKWRLRAEDYYTEARLHLPYTVYRSIGSARLQEIFLSTAEIFYGKFWVSITESLPGKIIDMNTGGIVEEYSIGSFCRKYRIRRSKVDRLMSDIGAEFYRTLLRQGYIGKEYVR